MIDLNLCDKQQKNALLRIKETGVSRLLQADDMATIHRLQGRCEAFKDLLTAIDDSPKVANRS